MELSKLLSIVIPCKNEGHVIEMLLDILNSQKGIEDVNVIVSDSSDDVYRVFDVIQKISKIFSPFCLGGFMLFRVDTFKKLGGFDESIKVAEDYMISKQIKRDKFKIHKSIVFTSPRRFQSKGLWYMLKLMIGSFFNKNNKKYFEEDKDYWI
jgi:cellulose synthase/poly-beta-1,6-N-acetylglucosamine synthase-like glycosyltransferase